MLRGAQLRAQAGRVGTDDRAMAQSGAGPRAGITFAGGNGRGDRHGDPFHAYLAVPEL